MKQSILAAWRRVVVVFFTTLMATIWAVASYAGPSQKAEGLWEYIPTSVVPEIALTCDDALPVPPGVLALTEIGQWSGTFNGSSNESGKLIIHCTGWFSFFAIVSFDNVEVNGKYGAMYMRVAGSKPDPFADWCGSWTILDGTDELTSLRGSGNWWGPGYNPGVPEQWGQIYYDGKIKWARTPLHEAKFEKCQDELCDDDDDSDSD